MLEGEIISIGSELLQGRMDDTNATYISRVMNEQGVNVRFRTTVADIRGDIKDALRRAATRADIPLWTISRLRPLPGSWEWIWCAIRA